MRTSSPPPPPVRAPRRPQELPDTLRLEGIPRVCHLLRDAAFLRFAGREPYRFDTLRHEPVQRGRAVDLAEVEALREACLRFLTQAGTSRAAVSAEDTIRAIVLVSREAPLHPAGDYLRGLTWDGVPRLHLVAQDILDVDEKVSTIADQLVRKWMIGAAARALSPGLRMDALLLLVGVADLPLQLFFRLLVPSALWADVPFARQGPASALRRAWIGTCTGPQSLEKEEDGATFAQFLTANDDTASGPFTLAGEVAPRTTVFSGVSNDVPRDAVPVLRHRL